jgi:hypothetical protein
VGALALAGNSFRIFSADRSAVTQGNQTGEDFHPLRYRPMAAKVMGLKKNIMSLNGAWRIDAKPGEDVREHPLGAPSWGSFHVPGQWVQQGV